MSTIPDHADVVVIGAGIVGNCLVGHLAQLGPGGRDDITMDDETAIPDERLELVFTCCPPALAPEARIALTLRLLGGLTVAEIEGKLRRILAADRRDAGEHGRTTAPRHLQREDLRRGGDQGAGRLHDAEILDV